MKYQNILFIIARQHLEVKFFRKSVVRAKKKGGTSPFFLFIEPFYIVLRIFYGSLLSSEPCGEE